MGQIIAIFVQGGYRQQVVLVSKVYDVHKGNIKRVGNTRIWIKRCLLLYVVAHIGNVGVHFKTAHIPAGALGTDEIDGAMA